jgi:hypothetical protein
MIHYWWVKKNRIKDLYNKKQIDLHFLKLSKEILYKMVGGENQITVTAKLDHKRLY